MSSFVLPTAQQPEKHTEKQKQSQTVWIGGTMGWVDLLQKYVEDNRIRICVSFCSCFDDYLTFRI